MEKWIQNFSQKEVGVSPTVNFFRRADVRELPLLFRIVREQRFLQTVMSLLEVMIQKLSRPLRQQLSNLIVLRVIFFLLIRRSMVLDVVTESSIREQKKIIVILKRNDKSQNQKSNECKPSSPVDRGRHPTFAFHRNPEAL